MKYENVFINKFGYCILMEYSIRIIIEILIF